MLTEKCLRVTFGLIAWLGVTESLDYLGVIQDIRLDLWNCNPLIPPDLLGEKGDWWASTYFGTSPSPVSVPVHSALREMKHVRPSALELTSWALGRVSCDYWLVWFNFVFTSLSAPWWPFWRAVRCPRNRKIPNAREMQGFGLPETEFISAQRKMIVVFFSRWCVDDFHTPSMEEGQFLPCPDPTQSHLMRATWWKTYLIPISLLIMWKTVSCWLSSI